MNSKVSFFVILVVCLIQGAAQAQSDEQWDEDGVKVCLDQSPGRASDPRGPVVSYSADGDPIYENMGPVVGHTVDGVRVTKKLGTVYGHNKTGVITGYDEYGTALYNGEKSASYSADGDRMVRCLRGQRPINPYDP